MRIAHRRPAAAAALRVSSRCCRVYEQNLHLTRPISQARVQTLCERPDVFRLVVHGMTTLSEGRLKKLSTLRIPILGAGIHKKSNRKTGQTVLILTCLRRGVGKFARRCKHKSGEYSSARRSYPTTRNLTCISEARTRIKARS